MLNIPCPVLQKIWEDKEFLAPNGDRVSLKDAGGVGWDFAEVLYRVTKQQGFKRCLEIGMASGFSTLSILSGLGDSAEQIFLTSIDPYQSTWCRGAGIKHVRDAGFADRHRLLEEWDYLALPKLLAAGEQFDFIYIDGNHEFDYVMLDFFFADKLLRKGGMVAFNDCGMPAVHAAMQHVPPRQRYEEVDVGLKPDFRGRNILVTGLRWLTNRNSADRYFRKLD